MQKLRVVEIDAIFDVNNVKSAIRNNPKKAWFHQWATVLSDNKEFTVAIVEDASGRIYRVPPESVKFEQPIFREASAM